MNKIALFYILGPLKWTFFISLLTSSYAMALVQDIATHSGYIQDIEAEKHELVEEVIPVFKPESNFKDLRPMIFQTKLSKEFKRKYIEVFGLTEAEQNFLFPKQISSNETAAENFIFEQERNEQQRDFGEYMVKRLVEFHADNFAKSNEKLRTVYEIKEAISNVNVKVKSGYEFKFNYNLAGNYIDFRLKNPLKIDTKLSLQMDKDNFGPTNVIEKTLVLGYKVNPITYVESLYAVEDGIAKFVAHKGLSRYLTASITASTYLRSKGESERERLLLFGFTWVN